MQKVIGYRTVLRRFTVSRPVEWGSRNGGFHELPEIVEEREVLEAVYEDLGPAGADLNCVTRHANSLGIMDYKGQVRRGLRVS